MENFRDRVVRFRLKHTYLLQVKMPKFFKAKVIKTGTSLTSKLNETWFAVKGRGLDKKDVKEFRDYLNECATEFLVPDKEDAPNQSATPSNPEEGPREVSETKKERRRAPWEE